MGNSFTRRRYPTVQKIDVKFKYYSEERKPIYIGREENSPAHTLYLYTYVGWEVWFLFVCEGGKFCVEDGQPAGNH